MPLGMEQIVEDENDEGQGEQQGNSQQRSRLTENALTQATEAQVKAKVLAEFMRDPGFAKLSEARINQKNVHILTDDEFQALQAGRSETNNSVVSNEQDPDFENMDKKTMVGYLIKQITKQVEPMFKGQMKPVQDQVSQLTSYADQMAQRQAQEEITSLQREFPDFPTYKEKMLELRDKAPGFSVKQLYLMAKAESGHLVPKAARTGSERPTSLMGRTNGKKRDHTKEALNNLISNKLNTLVEGLDDSMDFGE